MTHNLVMSSQEKLLNLLKKAGNIDQQTENLQNDIYKKCAICHKFSM